MKLKEARKLDDHHPPADQRLAMLRQHLESFRADFYGHLQTLERCDTWESLGITEISPLTTGLPHVQSVDGIREQAEQALDVLHGSIEKTQAEIAAVEKALKAVNPDA